MHCIGHVDWLYVCFSSLGIEQRSLVFEARNQLQPSTLASKSDCRPLDDHFVARGIQRYLAAEEATGTENISNSSKTFRLEEADNNCQNIETATFEVSMVG